MDWYFIIVNDKEATLHKNIQQIDTQAISEIIGNSDLIPNRIHLTTFFKETQVSNSNNNPKIQTF